MDELPKDIKHQILSCLRMRDGARASRVSKAWRSAWDSRPVMVFETGSMWLDKFQNYILRSLQRKLDSGFSTAELRLLLDICRQPLADAVRRFILTVNLKELELTVLNQTASYLNLLSCTALNKLKLSGIDLKQPGGPCDPWDFPCLRSLELEHVTLDKSAIGELVSASPSLEELTLSGYIQTLTSLDIRHDRLKKVEVRVDPELRKIALRIPSLESFVCTYHLIPVDPEIELEGCEATLKELSITGIACKCEWVQRQIYRFRGLEVLILGKIFSVTRLKISSPLLTDLRISTFSNLFAAEIYAPNLRHLEYVNNKYPFYPLATCESSSSLESLFIFSSLRCADGHISEWLEKLSELIDMINDWSNVVVSIMCKHKVVIVHRGLNDALFDIILDLFKSVQLLYVNFATNYKSWSDKVVNPCLADDIYVASTYDDSDDLSERLSKSLLLGELKYVHQVCLLSYTIETLEDWSEFEGDDETRHALLRAYNESSSRFTRFGLDWTKY